MNALPLRRRAKRAASRQWAPTVTGWSESTYAEQAWDASRSAGLRWAIWGLVVGVIVAVIAFAPAAWLARAVAHATDERVLLAEARGTVWSGSAVLVLTAGLDSREARSLPGRLEWSIGWRGLGLELRLRHACCLNGTVALQVKPGFGRMAVTLLSPPGPIGQWPGALLGGLGTPWNTLQLGGAVRLATRGFTLESVQGRWRLNGEASLELIDAASRVATVDPLGSYRLSVSGDPATPGTSRLSLQTVGGALQLSGNGTWGPGGVRFRGEASAATPADEPALNNLLNIIGRRNGARSVISIG
jgi:general secretion pathway protein N